MPRALFSPPLRDDSPRAWKVCTLVSLLFHGLVLGALALALPVNLARPPDTGVSIDLDLVTAGKPLPEAEPATPPEPPQVTGPEKTVEPMPEPSPQKAEAPKPAPKKARPSKQEAHRKTAAANARADGPKAPGNIAQSAKAPGKTTGTFSASPAPLGGARSPRPPYPDLARKRGQEGTVNIRCQVDAQGMVTAVSIAKSSGFKLLDDAALKTVSKWKFRAGSKDGTNVAGTVVVPVQFKLQ